MATTPAVELELQILNAIFLGILCGIGMLYFQDLMPEKNRLCDNVICKYFTRRLDYRRLC